MSRWPNKYVIGLTGNIATGKSVVRQMLQHLGAYPIDADNLAHQVMMPNAPAYKPIVDMFGKSIIGADGRINRAMLGQIVFSNPDLLKKLEEITHPIIRQGINALAGRATQPVIVIEAIKLLDGDLSEWVDAVWVVDAKPQMQYQRLVGKRKMSEAEAKQRIQAQPPQAEKLKRASVVIDNNGNVEETWKQVQHHWNEIRKSASTTATTQPQVRQTQVQQPIKQPEAVRSVVTEAAPPSPAAPAGAAAISVKRGMPGNAQSIADFITASSGQATNRMDVMMSFGQKSYLVAQAESGKVVGLMGWTVENLVTQMDEFYTAADASVETVVHAMVLAIEEASKELQSEVAFFFLPGDAPKTLLDAYSKYGYTTITLKDIKVPVWREAVEETLQLQPAQILWKQLRKDRVLQPI